MRLKSITLSALLVATLGAGAQSASALTVYNSIGELNVTDAKPGQLVEMMSTSGKVIQSGKADKFGSKSFHDLPEGRAYKIRAGSTVKKAKTRKRDDNPPQSFYDKIKLKPGLNYVKMRDGIELAMTVRLPAGKTFADGPFPAMIEYSGYQAAAPGDLLSAFLGGASDPLAPATSTIVGGALGQLLGFASISVQIRGSGCSGGHYGLFDTPEAYDGYDAIETVAAQPWVKGGVVGMYGISFSGISQLEVAGTRPPHLAAISPMSVTSDLYTGTGYPGGIFNKGFALSWLTERVEDAKPAPGGGQPWAKELVKRGDKHCINNQRLRLQTVNVLKLLVDVPYRTPLLHNDRSPSNWMSRITVPTFIVSAFQDEQTGGQFGAYFGNFADNDRVWLSMINGAHIDSLGPSTVTRWFEFLKLYVADEIPVLPSTITGLSGALYQQISGAGSIPVEQSRFAEMTSTSEARAIFERDPRVRLLMDNGASDQGLGSLGATWEIAADQWPIREVAPANYYLDGSGKLTTAKPAAATASYKSDPSARNETTLGNGEANVGRDAAWVAQPPYLWKPIVAGKGLAWATDPLASDLVIAGSSSFDVYVKSSAKDTDLQVTLTEIRPDGNETYVQNGYLRASHRKLAADSTALQPNPTHLPEDAANLPKGQYSLVRIPVFPVAHAFRAGSRIRVSIEAPGGDRPSWKFATIEKGNTTNTLALGGARASKLVLPVLPGANAKGTPLPEPTALRGEPNRQYVPASNGG